MTADAPRFAAGLQGSDLSLRRWRRDLAEPFFAWARLETMPWGEATVLYSPGISDSVDEPAARAAAERLVEQLNGVMQTTRDAFPVTLDGVIRFAPDGSATIARHARAELVMEPMLIEMTLSSASSGPPPAPHPSPVQRIIAAAEQDERLEELLVFAGRADNWFDVYKAIEMAESIVGGERALRAAMGDEGDELKRMRTTANHHRHAPSRYPAPMPPFELRTCKALIGRVVEKVAVA